MLQNSNIEFLYSLEKFGIKLGLQNTIMLLSKAGNPHKLFKTIHVAGTNGKGSVSSYIASILIEQGLKVGHYTSPHLERFNERIKVNNIEISDDELGIYTEEFRNTIIETKATFFEATTTIAFKYFADKGVDFAVIETGLGGRFDSTNVINPLVSVITNISFDHIQQLGNSISSIAFEKAGIIKKSIPCITASENQEVIQVFERACDDMNSILYNVNDIFRADNYEILQNGIKFLLSDGEKTYDIFSPMNGFHQIKNIMCAVETVKLLNDSGVTVLSKETIVNGIKNVIRNTGLHCRFETFSKNPYIILDVAHNTDSIKTVIESIKIFKKNKLRIVFGIMKDKAYDEVVDLLASVSDEIYCVKPYTERALSSEVIAGLFYGKTTAFAMDSVGEAINYALEKNAEEDIILITGSHYVCGEALTILKEKCLDKI